VVALAAGTHGYSPVYGHRVALNNAGHYGNNATAPVPWVSGITSVPMVEPSTFVSSTTKHVVITYTLGDGRAITKTITKTITRTKEVVPTILMTPYSNEHTPTSAPTFTVTQPKGGAPSAPPAVVPEESVQSYCSTKTITKTVANTVTATATKVVTLTLGPVPAPMSVSLANHVPPYANTTVRADSDTTTTVLTTMTTTISLGPTGSGGISYY